LLLLLPRFKHKSKQNEKKFIKIKKKNVFYVTHAKVVQEITTSGTTLLIHKSSNIINVLHNHQNDELVKNNLKMGEKIAN